MPFMGFWRHAFYALWKLSGTAGIPPAAEAFGQECFRASWNTPKPQILPSQPPSEPGDFACRGPHSIAVSAPRSPGWWPAPACRIYTGAYARNIRGQTVPPAGPETPDPVSPEGSYRAAGTADPSRGAAAAPASPAAYPRCGCATCCNCAAPEYVRRSFREQY